MLISTLMFVLVAVLLLVLVDNLPMLGQYQGWIKLVVVVLLLIAAIAKFGPAVGI